MVERYRHFHCICFISGEGEFEPVYQGPESFVCQSWSSIVCMEYIILFDNYPEKKNASMWRIWEITSANPWFEKIITHAVS